MADKKLPISVVISAVDNVTYRVMAINEKLKKITAPVGKVQSAFSSLGEEAGLGALSNSLSKIGSTGKDLFNELSGAILKVGATAIAAATGIFELTSGFARAGDDISMMSRRLGLTTNQYQELAYAAKKANVPAEEFNGAMEKFSKGIGEAATGQGEAIHGFAALGINIYDGTGHLKKMNAMLPEVAQGLSKIGNQSVRNLVAIKMFGRTGEKLNDLFEGGAQSLKEAAEEANKVGAVMSPEQINTASQFDDGMKSIGSTLLMVRNIIGAALAPEVLKLGQQLQETILKNRDKIAQWGSDFAKDLPGRVSTILSAFERVAQAVIWLSDTFGPMTLMIAAAAAYFAPLITAALAFSGALAGGIIPTVTFVIKTLSMLWTVLSTIFTVMVGLIGLPATLAIALGGLGVLLYKKWEPFRDLVDSIWSKISGFLGLSASVNTDMTTSTGPNSSQLAPAFGFAKTVDASNSTRLTDKSESHVLVEFQNMPQGTRVESKKHDPSLDFLLGYSMGG